METKVALLEKNDSDMTKSIDLLDRKVDQIQNNQKEHSAQSQKQHLENMERMGQLKETLLVNFGTIKEYVDLKIKEHKIEVDKEYAKKDEHRWLTQRVEKIESVFGYTRKTVLGIVIVGIFAALFGQPK